MKILASTTTLTKAIEKALAEGVVVFKIDTDAKHIAFSETIIISIEAKGQGNYHGGLNRPLFTKLLEFLKLLEEQPILIEFTEYHDTLFHGVPEISLSQFVKRF